MTNPENVTKFEAAERQLRVAIQLFFQRADPVAVQTLTSAASRVLHDLARYQGIPNLIRESEVIRPERKREWIQELNRAPNFFKHADRDPNEVLEFHRDGVEWSLLEAVDLFGRLKRGYIAETLTFCTWFYVKYPNLVVDEKVQSVLGAADRRHLPSVEDLDLFLEVLRLNQALEQSGKWPPAPHAV